MPNKVYCTTICPYCNREVGLHLKCREDAELKAVVCDNLGCGKDFLIRYSTRTIADIKAEKVPGSLDGDTQDDITLGGRTLGTFAQVPGEDKGWPKIAGSSKTRHSGRDGPDSTQDRIFSGIGEDTGAHGPWRDSWAGYSSYGNSLSARRIYVNEIRRDGDAAGCKSPEQALARLEKMVANLLERSMTSAKETSESAELYDIIDEIVVEQSLDRLRGLGKSRPRAAEDDVEFSDDRRKSRVGRPFAATWSKEALVEEPEE